MNNLILIGIGVLVLVIIGFVIYIKRKIKAKKILKVGKTIGASEARDEIRIKVVNKVKDQIKTNEKIIAKADDQIKTNEKVIARSNDAIIRARKAREKAFANLNN